MGCLMAYPMPKENIDPMGYIDPIGHKPIHGTQVTPHNSIRVPLSLKIFGGDVHPDNIHRNHIDILEGYICKNERPVYHAACKDEHPP